MRPHPISFELGFALLEALTALTIFSGSYVALVSTHQYISSLTHQQSRHFQDLIEQSNQHETEMALLELKDD